MAFGSRSLPPLLPDEEGILGAEEVRLEVGARVTSRRCPDEVEVNPGPAEAELEEDEVAAKSNSLLTLGLFEGGGRSGLDEAKIICEMNLVPQRECLLARFPCKRAD